MLLVAILMGTLAAGIGSVWVAAALSFGVLSRYTQHMLSMAAGALLATAFLHLLPEAFESQAGAHDLFLTLLVGLVFFFLLDKAELWHHGHEHHHDATPPPPPPPRHHAHEHPQSHVHVHAAHTGHTPHGHDHSHAHKPGSWAVLTGDSVHCFGDGILIASAFIADLRLGAIAALAVLAHEVPHHMGDLVVLRGGTGDRRMALVKVSLAGAVTALGGTVGYFLLDRLHAYLPYFLAVASSSFIYVALADLIPQLQKRLSARETFAQIAWLGAGIGLVTLVSGLAHTH
jgi:zinc and cadmium transporter